LLHDRVGWQRLDGVVLDPVAVAGPRQLQQLDRCRTDVDPDQRCLAFCDQPHAFLPMSRALTRASCPTALNNGVFTRWQQAVSRSVSHRTLGHLLTHCVTPSPDRRTGVGRYTPRSATTPAPPDQDPTPR